MFNQYQEPYLDTCRSLIEVSYGDRDGKGERDRVGASSRWHRETVPEKYGFAHCFWRLGFSPRAKVIKTSDEYHCSMDDMPRTIVCRDSIIAQTHRR